MSAADFERKAGRSDDEVRESSLEAYANAVRMYQGIVLELQDAQLQDPATRGNILERAAAAKEMANQYRIASRAATLGS